MFCWSHKELVLEFPSAFTIDDSPLNTKPHVHAYGMTEMSSSQRANWADVTKRKQSCLEIPTMLHFGTSLHRSRQGTAERVVSKKKRKHTKKWETRYM